MHPLRLFPTPFPHGNKGYETVGDLRISFFGKSGNGLNDATLYGKNKLADIIEGLTDANILLMTDDANGDALFVDDVFTDLMPLFSVSPRAHFTPREVR